MHCILLIYTNMVYETKIFYQKTLNTDISFFQFMKAGHYIYYLLRVWNYQVYDFVALVALISFTIHVINSACNFSIQNCTQNSDRVQFRTRSPKRYIIKHLKNTKLYSVKFLRTEMTSDSSSYRKEHSLRGMTSFLS